ncbi:unnamed protein product, partial [Amoebophrya sp. A25]
PHKELLREESARPDSSSSSKKLSTASIATGTSTDFDEPKENATEAGAEEQGLLEDTSKTKQSVFKTALELRSGTVTDEPSVDGVTEPSPVAAVDETKVARPRDHREDPEDHREEEEPLQLLQVIDSSTTNNKQIIDREEPLLQQTEAMKRLSPSVRVKVGDTVRVAAHDLLDRVNAEIHSLEHLFNISEIAGYTTSDDEEEDELERLGLLGALGGQAGQFNLMNAEHEHDLDFLKRSSDGNGLSSDLGGCGIGGFSFGFRGGRFG